ncbi:molybdenum cofactor biosynthesis protein MoaE [Paenibacillus sp. GCM10012303]|uniref:molybdenum cofactor biosynthesis protein n=1 Tax=Paenibacillus sp. GCM10012303 TaxID=3317340 RepID=UPI00361DD518
MQLVVRVFAGLSDALGASTVPIDIQGETLTGAELKELLSRAYPAASGLIRTAFIAKNQAYASDNDLLSVTDEIAVIPPVSGGQQEPVVPSSSVDETLGLHRITTSPLTADEVSVQVADDEHGASLVFIGTTRRTTLGQRTVLLEYEAYVPMALKTLQQISDEIRSRWPGSLTAISHRIGTVPVGETSVVIAVSTPHRADCYEASRYAIERLKEIVPIWKKEVWEDGSQWKGPQSGAWNPMRTT